MISAAEEVGSSSSTVELDCLSSSAVDVVESPAVDVREVALSTSVDEAIGSPSPPLRISSATFSSTQPTLTPAVTFIGIAKQLCPSSQVLKPNFPAALHVPILPSIHATVPDWHSVSEVIVLKNLLYS